MRPAQLRHGLRDEAYACRLNPKTLSPTRCPLTHCPNTLSPYMLFPTHCAPNTLSLNTMALRCCTSNMLYPISLTSTHLNPNMPKPQHTGPLCAQIPHA